MKRQIMHSVHFLLALPLVGLQAQSYTCRPASDSTAIVQRDYLVQLVTATDTGTVADRAAYNLPSTTANKVTVVGSGSVCNSAGTAYHAVVRPGTPAISRTLTVIKIGSTRYVVGDPNELHGEFSTTIVFDTNWVSLAGWDS